MPPDASEEKTLRYFNSDHRPAFLVFRPPLPRQPKLFDKLRSALPGCTIILLTGEKMPESLPQWSFAQRLTPELAEGVETEAITTYFDAFQRLGPRSG
jgi:hypothetical protein